MRVAFYTSTKAWCTELASYFGAGVHKHGDHFHAYTFDEPMDPIADVFVMLGAGTFDNFAKINNSGRLVCYMDKGWIKSKDFTPEGAYFHLSIGGYRPSYIGKLCMPDDRRKLVGWEPKPWRSHKNSGHVLLAWSSVKYHQFLGMPPPDEYAEQIINEIREWGCDRSIVYRQKPNQIRKDVVGALTSPEGISLASDLEGAHCLVTVGSSCCLWAMLAGVPSICLGDTIISNICNSSTRYINYPYLAMESQRLAVLNDLAYSQWHLHEYAKGDAWQFARPLIERMLHERYRSHGTAKLA